MRGFSINANLLDSNDKDMATLLVRLTKALTEKGDAQNLSVIPFAFHGTLVNVPSSTFDTTQNSSVY